jgi:ABC-type glycerol-3-phosphate transport system permease component
MHTELPLTGVRPRARGRLGAPADLKSLFLGSAMIGWMLVVFLPFAWALSTALKDQKQAYIFPPRFFPNPIVLGNFGVQFQQGLANGLLNSAVVSTMAVLLTLLTAAMCAYPLARMSFRGDGVILFLIVVPMMIPGLVNLVPTYMILATIGVLNTYLGLILVYWVQSLPISIWILRGFFQALPYELEEAAVMDGASPWQTLFSVLLPIAQPALLAVAVLVFLAAWNDFIIASIITSSAEMRTAQIYLYANIGDTQTDWGGLMAAAVVVTIPVVVVFAVLQRRFVAGLTTGALKG